MASKHLDIEIQTLEADSFNVKIIEDGSVILNGHFHSFDSIELPDMNKMLFTFTRVERDKGDNL